MTRDIASSIASVLGEIGRGVSPWVLDALPHRAINWRNVSVQGGVQSLGDVIPEEQSGTPAEFSPAGT